MCGIVCFLASQVSRKRRQKEARDERRSREEHQVVWEPSLNAVEEAEDFEEAQLQEVVRLSQTTIAVPISSYGGDGLESC